MKKFLFLTTIFLSLISASMQAQSTNVVHILDSMAVASSGVDTVYMYSTDIPSRTNFTSVVYADSISGAAVSGVNGTVLLQYALSGSSSQQDTYKDWVTLDSFQLVDQTPQKSVKTGTIDGSKMRLLVSLRSGSQTYRVRWHIGRSKTCL